jgi:hypothetical protein
LILLTQSSEKSHFFGSWLTKNGGELIVERLVDLIRKPFVVKALSLVVGLCVGLGLGLIVGWGVWPVEWQDAEPQHLHPGAKEDYLRLIVDSNALHPDSARLRWRWERLQPGAEDILADVEANPGAQGNDLDEFLTTLKTMDPLPSVAVGDVFGLGDNRILLTLSGIFVLGVILGGTLTARILFRRRPLRVKTEILSADTYLTERGGLNGFPLMIGFILKRTLRGALVLL